MEWQSNQVISIFGKKRSGKSQFAKTVLWPQIDTIVCWDKKFEHTSLAEEEGVYIAHNLEGCIELIDTRKVKKVVYQPYVSSADDFNNLCKWAFYRGNITIWCDELASIATPLKFPYYLGEIIRLGQIRGIGVILVSQRPALIPSLMISECDVVVSFRLQLMADSEKVCAVMGEAQINELMHIEDYYFIIYDFKNLQRCSPLNIGDEAGHEAGDINVESEEVINETEEEPL
jgi:hypothetical protein